MDHETARSFVETEDATFRGPVGPVFAHTTISLQPGERWAVLGPSGGERVLFFSALMGRLPLLDRRLVLLARAVVHRPPLLLLDEPCQGLDAPDRLTLVAAISAAVTALGAAMIYVTHDPGELPASIDRMLRLDHGQVTHLGPWARAGSCASGD